MGLTVCFFILLSLAVARLDGQGQVDSILSLPAEQQQEVIYQLHIRYEQNGQKRLAMMTPLAASLGQRGREDLEEMIWSLLWVDKYNPVAVGDSIEETRFLRQLIEEAKDRKWTRAEAECKFHLGFLLFGWRRFGEGLDLMIESYAYLKRNGFTSPYMQMLMLDNLSMSYYHFGDYASCLDYLLQSLKTELPKTSAGYPYKAYNTIGLCYQKLQNPDSAIFYYKSSYDLAAIRNDSLWMALTTGNIGNVYFLSGRYDEALPYLEKDYQSSIRVGNNGSAVNAGVVLASIELRRGRVSKAEEYIDFAKAHLDTFLDTRLAFYENLYLFHKLKGESHLALQYVDSVFVLKRRKEILRDRKILEQARMKAAYEEYDAQILSLQQERSRQLYLRNGLFGLFILSTVAAYVWIKRHQKRRQASMLRLQEAEVELQGYIRSLLEKNEMIQSLRERLEVKDIADDPTEDRSHDISQLTQLNILTEEDWKHFRKLFDVVYPGFLVRLREKLGDLTPAETRILVLAKLHVPQKEMGDMLGISYNSIRTSRYRLRKKLSLPEEGSLEELVEYI